jgi:hypothetical protein
MTHIQTFFKWATHSLTVTHTYTLTLHFFSICSSSSRFATFFAIKAHLVYIYSGSLLIFTTTCGSWKHISTSLAEKQEIVYGGNFIMAEVIQP